jgi:hypothetical protein
MNLNGSLNFMSNSRSLVVLAFKAPTNILSWCLLKLTFWKWYPPLCKGGRDVWGFLFSKALLLSYLFFDYGQHFLRLFSQQHCQTESPIITHILCAFLSCIIWSFVHVDTCVQNVLPSFVHVKNPNGLQCVGQLLSVKSCAWLSRSF